MKANLVHSGASAAELASWQSRWRQCLERLLVFMASENSNGSNQLWTPLPSLPRISVASSTRGRLAHRRPMSIPLPSQLPQSSSSHSSGDKLESLNSSVAPLPSRISSKSNSAPDSHSSLPPSAASGLGAADSDSSLAPISEQDSSSIACLPVALSSPDPSENSSVASLKDEAFRITSPSPSSGARGLPGSAGACGPQINPNQVTAEALPQPSAPVAYANSQRQQGKSVEEIDSISRKDHTFSLGQSPALLVEVAEPSKNLGFASDESEPEEGQLPGEWSGSDDSVEESNHNPDKNFNFEDCSTPSLVGEEGLTVAQFARLSHIQFQTGNKSSLVSCSTFEPAGYWGRKTQSVEKKRKKHKKGEGAKKRAREKSAQKYKEKKKQRIKTSAVEQQGQSSAAGLGKGEQPETHNAKRSNVENVTQVSENQERSVSKTEVVEEGEITEAAQTSTGILSSLVEAEVGLWTTDDVDDQIVAQMEKEVAGKKKRGPETAERMLKRKIAKRKKRAKKEKELGIRKRRPLDTVNKPPPKVLCTHFMKGRCAKGENCPFSHDAVPLTKQEPCKFLMSRSCLKGDNCPFSHDLKAFPCKFFHTRGLCYDGDKCLFSHRPITEEEREKLLKRVEKDKERGSNASVFGFPTPDFTSSLPGEEDPDPLGWGTANSCPSFDVDLRDLHQRSPEAMCTAPMGSFEAEYDNITGTSYLERSNREISSYSTVNDDMHLQSADILTNSEGTCKTLDHVDTHHTTGSAPVPEASSTVEISAVTLAAPVFPTQRGSLLVKGLLEPKRSVPRFTQTTGSRKLTVESLLGEVLKQ